MKLRVLPSPFLVAGLVLTSCFVAGERSEGLATTERTGGPRVIWDIEERPLPRIPLPNDAATRLDPTSPTGRRLNISLEAATTEHERETRRQFNKLDGFSTYGGINVSFDRLLDLENIDRRHNENDDFRDDAVFLLNVDPSCERFGEEIALDFGRGRFPVIINRNTRRIVDPEAPDGYRLDESRNVMFPFDPDGLNNNIFFAEHNENLHEDVFDPEVDIPGDDRIIANFLDPHACDAFDRGTREHSICVADNLLTWYDRADNTLILRNLWPMEQRCTHAVVLTKRIVDLDGKPVESPFDGINPRDQTEALRPIETLLPRYDLTLEDVAFAWTFTTGSMTEDLETIRRGLYGHGPFARLAEQFPPESFTLLPVSGSAEGAGGVFAPGGCAGAALTGLWRERGEWRTNRCSIEADKASIGGLVYGYFDAPNFLADKTGKATETYPLDHVGAWDLDHPEKPYGTTRVTFWCALPLELDTSCSPGNPEGKPFCKPFPTILYGHGYGGARAEVTLHFGRHTAMGYAICGNDSFGHGLNAAKILPAEGVATAANQYGLRGFIDMLYKGRARDLNNDLLQIPDSGGDQWSGHIVHTRDVVRQSVVEYMQFVRILRSFDGELQSTDGDILGDFDGDGRVDIGGSRNTVAMWGISLGGILGGVLGGAEPGLDAVSPNAAAGGLTDVSVRSRQAGVPEFVHLISTGPVVIGRLPTDGHQNPREGDLRLQFYASDYAAPTLAQVEFARVAGIEAGDRVILENLDNGETYETRVNERGWFRASVAADAIDPIVRRPLLGLLEDDQVGPVSYENTPDLGSRLEVRFYDPATEELKATVNTFGEDVTFQGTRYPEGAPLVALQPGLGYRRNTPDYRRFLSIAQHAIATADPAVWAAHYREHPLDVSDYDPHWYPERQTRVLVMPTAGDMVVPVSTGIAQARAAGFLGSWRRDESLPAEYGWREIFMPDPRYGKSIDQMLIDNYVTEGIDRFTRFTDRPPEPYVEYGDHDRFPHVLFDADNHSDGTARFSCGDSDWSARINETLCRPEDQGEEIFFAVPHTKPGHELRQNLPREDGTHDAFRIPVLRPGGQHGIYNSQSFREFDHDAFMVNFTIRFLGTRGREVSHVPGCDCSASRIPEFMIDGEHRGVAFTPDQEGEERYCTTDLERDHRLKVCDPACAEAWGIRTPAKAVCNTQ